MCGYYYSHNKIIPSGLMQNIKCRGPEGFTSLHLGNEYFGHSLLNTRGKSTTQPIQNKHGTLVYNGSTYNSAGNDTQWIAGNLDNRSSVTIELIRNAVRADANKIYIINKQTFSLDILETTQWNFSQHNNNYDKLFETFEQAVKDRHEPGITTYMLSAGIDVGAIACCANKFFDIQTVSKIGKEDINVLTQRLELQKSPWIDPADDSDYIEESDKMFQQYKLDYLRSSSARALTAILQNHLLPNKQKICISGVGGDELYDDYMPDKFTHGRVGKVNGGWPSELRTIYPWHNYEGTRMAKQLHRSDTVCGHHGIEARYPLADQRVFQQWLNTTSKLKNSGYKHWLVKYLKEHNYPLTMDKTGFTSERDRIR